MQNRVIRHFAQSERNKTFFVCGSVIEYRSGDRQPRSFRRFRHSRQTNFGTVPYGSVLG
jgi:hypothetical protein